MVKSTTGVLLHMAGDVESLVMSNNEWVKMVCLMQMLDLVNATFCRLLNSVEECAIFKIFFDLSDGGIYRIPIITVFIFCLMETLMSLTGISVIAVGCEIVLSAISLPAIPTRDGTQSQRPINSNTSSADMWNKIKFIKGITQTYYYCYYDRPRYT